MTERILSSVLLEGERVRVRAASAGDAAGTFRLLHGREEVLAWLVWDGPRDVQELESSYSNWAAPHPEGVNYLFAICEPGRDEAVGIIGPRFRGHPGCGDLGYWLAPEFWGRGLMTDAVRLTTYLCFEHLRAEGMFAQAFVGNAGSRVVLERNGYKMERVLREAVLKRGRRVDEWYFALDRETWKASLGDWRPRREDVRFER